MIIRLLFAILSLLVSEVHAQAEVTSPNYIIQMPNFNSGAGIPSSTTYSIGITVGQTAPGLYSSTGYRIKSGFQYIYSIIPFSFSISTISINFGHLVAATPATASGTLTVSAGGAGGYQVNASENNAMKISSSGKTIPDTTCDTTCSETAAGAWLSNSRYGFGFNMSGNDIPADFTDGTYFRQFANVSLGKTPQTVMSSVYVWRARQSTVTYKVNVSATQAAGTYRNIIMFTAIPSY